MILSLALSIQAYKSGLENLRWAAAVKAMFHGT